ncbi:hypothetical protein HZA40_02855 [Candidatus Peregrinibacteria bacterium]|nr:hypothetical protein [Candidatus Peregrinibacteria bacterium]
MKKTLLVVVMAGLILVGCSGKPKGISTVPSKDESIGSLNCNKGMSEYKLANSPVQFCYDKTWGEPVVTAAKAKTGSAETVNFGTADNDKAPMLWIESNDYAPASGEKAVNFTLLNAMAADEAKLKTQIKNAAGYDEKNIKSARKTDVSTVRSIRAEVGGNVNKLIYFIPFAYEGYNMVISGNADMAEVVDNLAFDMVL